MGFFDNVTTNNNPYEKYGLIQQLTPEAQAYQNLMNGNQYDLLPLVTMVQKANAEKQFQQDIGLGGKGVLLDPNWLQTGMLNPNNVKYDPRYGYYANTSDISWPSDGGFFEAASPILKFAALAGGACVS